MKLKLCTSILFLLLDSNTFGARKIIASTTPVASIVAMLVEDNAEIGVVANANSCPHHYHARPSDLSKIQDAELIIYIDDKFDKFIIKLASKTDAKLLKISSLKSLKLIKKDEVINWHFWLDIPNVISALEEISPIIASHFPELEDPINLNLAKYKIKLAELSAMKDRTLAELPKTILASDSLEYIFGSNEKILELFQPSHSSLKYINQLKQAVNSRNYQCLILSSDQNIKLYQKLNIPIVQIDSESWQLSSKLENSFYDNYLKVIEKLSTCHLGS